MYLSNKQISALQMAQEAMEYRNSGELDEEQEEAHEIIASMIRSAIKERQRRNRLKK